MADRSGWAESDREISFDEERARALVAASVKAGEALDYDASASTIEREEPGFLDAQDRARLDQEVRRRLVEAGEGLLDTLEAVTDDEDLWRRLTAGHPAARRPGTLTFEQMAHLREVLAHNIPATLRHLGYRPPPPAEQWAVWTQEPLEALLVATRPDDPAFSRRAVRAQYELTLFVKRFRTLVGRARAELDRELRVEEPRENRFMRRLLATTVRVGQNRAVLAALAAGAATALITGPLGGVAGLVGGVVISESIREFLKVCMEQGAVEAIARAGRGPSQTADPREALVEILALVDQAAHRLAYIGGEPHSEDWRRWEFIAQRALFDFIQELPPSLRELREQAWMLAVFAMRELQDGNAEFLHRVVSHLERDLRRVADAYER